MFERFTSGARTVVTGAQAHARDLGAARVGAEHLLLALADGTGDAAAALAAVGADAGTLRRAARRDDDPLDPDALRAVGIDLDAVRAAAEATFGTGALEPPARRSGGHLPFTAEAKKALELSLRHAVRLKQKRIETGHILLGVLHDDHSPATRALTGSGVDITALRADMTTRLTNKAA